MKELPHHLVQKDYDFLDVFRTDYFPEGIDIKYFNSNGDERGKSQPVTYHEYIQNLEFQIKIAKLYAELHGKG